MIHGNQTHQLQPPEMTATPAKMRPVASGRRFPPRRLLAPLEGYHLPVSQSSNHIKQPQYGPQKHEQCQYLMLLNQQFLGPSCISHSRGAMKIIRHRWSGTKMDLRLWIPSHLRSRSTQWPWHSCPPGGQWGIPNKPLLGIVYSWLYHSKPLVPSLKKFPKSDLISTKPRCPKRCFVMEGIGKRKTLFRPAAPCLSHGASWLVQWSGS